MNLLNPIWLWALGGLSIPMAIHLLSRKEGKTIRIGSIRFLTETSTSKFSSIRLNEVALLVIRSLLIIALVVFLAGLIISSSNSKSEKPWLLIEQSFEDDQTIKTLIDSLQKSNYEVRWLNKDFPPIETTKPVETVDYYWLIEKLSTQSREVRVIATSQLSNFKGKRISLPKNITWLSYPANKTVDKSESVPKKDTLKISIAFDKDFLYDKNIIAAALKAVQSIAPSEIHISEHSIENVTPGTDWIIWLSEKENPHQANTLQFSKEVSSNLIIQKSKTKWIMTEHPDENNSVQQHLPVQLAHMLFGKNIDYRQIIIPNELAFSKTSETVERNAVYAGQSADKTLILIIVFLFISERIFAFYRKQ